MSAADFYTGIVTDVYSVLRGTTFDAAPYLEFVTQTGEPALELGCGDDGPFLELARRGLDIEGVDSSADMLARCQAKANAEGLRVVTHCQRMENFSLQRSYRSIYLAGPTFNLLPDDDTAQRALTAIARHLAIDGTVMIPLWIPSATPREEWGISREAVTADGTIARYSVESEDYDEALRVRSSHSRYELVRDGQAEHLLRDWIIHWHTPDGFASLAKNAGLKVRDMTAIVDGEFTAYLER